MDPGPKSNILILLILYHNDKELKALPPQQNINCTAYTAHKFTKVGQFFLIIKFLWVYLM